MSRSGAVVGFETAASTLVDTGLDPDTDTEAIESIQAAADQLSADIEAAEAFDDLSVREKLDYDESTIRSYLNELVDLGLLQKSQLNREGGGFVTVFHSVDLEEMRRETLTGFYVWAGEAAALIEQANLTKEDYLESDHERGLDAVFWEQFEEVRSGE